MDKDYEYLKRLFAKAGLGLAFIMFIVYAVMLLMVYLMLDSCGVNRITYKQTESRFMQKSDSLNFKVEPSKVIDYERYH